MICAYKDIYKCQATSSTAPNTGLRIIFTSRYCARVPLNFRETSLIWNRGCKKVQNKSKNPQKNRPSIDDSHPCLADFSGVFSIYFNYFLHPRFQIKLVSLKLRVSTSENNLDQDLYWGLCCCRYNIYVLVSTYHFI